MGFSHVYALSYCAVKGNNIAISDSLRKHPEKQKSAGWKVLFDGKNTNKWHTMARTTLTDNFLANDILWQLNVLAYNMSVMMRQKKSKFKKQEHRTFIDWFIAVPAKITSSGHQIELKMYEHHFCKVDREELGRLIEAA